MMSQAQPTHAGGVVYRHTARGPEFLLVRSKDRTCRVLPKGHIDPGEDAPGAAVREVREETGYALQAGPPLGVASYGSGRRRVVTAYYLMDAGAGSAGPLEEPFRDPRWFTLEDLGAADLPVPHGVEDLLARARAAVGPPR
jgi:8-oxo-(d)GTP phosphatase